MSTLTRVTSWLANIGSTLQGAVSRLLDEKLSDRVSVKDFGAKGDGVTDDTLAFSLAAKAVQVKENSPAVYKPMPHAPFGEVYVPDGTYLISSLVDTGGRAITWVATGGASFSNSDNLNGRLFRPGIRNNVGEHQGTLDHASSFSVSGNRGMEAPAQILGVTAPDQLAVYTDRDSVGFHAENFAPNLLASTGNCTFNSTGLVLPSPLSAVQVKKLRVGMIIDTKHTPTKYTGVITGWSQDGLTITVEGWYLADGVNSSHSKVTPPSGVGVNINPFTKVWAMNANVFMDANSHAIAAAAMELGVSNNKFDYDPVTDTWHTWCYDAITLGSKRCETAYMQRGYFYKGYESRGATGYNYTARNSSPTSWAGLAVYHSTANTDLQIQFQPDMYGKKTSFAVTKEGCLEVGRTDSPSTTFIDFHTYGDDKDFDARISCTGGTASEGQATMTLYASQFNWSNGYIMESSGFRPSLDATKNLGQAGYRWNTLYASTGTINTSDVNLKTFLSIDEKEKEAAKEIRSMFRKFQFNDAISSKGNLQARYHFGVGAQYVRDVLTNHGLDWERYAFICFDKWDDEYEDIYEEVTEIKEAVGVFDEPVYKDGEVVGLNPVRRTYKYETKSMVATGEKRLVREAGEMYGIRYDELVAFILACS